MSKNYFDAVGEDQSTASNRREIINGIKAFVQDEFDAETSQLNLNAWKLRFDIDVEDYEEFVTVVDGVNSLVEAECPIDVELEWDIIPTDSNNRKNGWFSVGTGDIYDANITNGSYPIEAFRVTVPR